MTDAAVAERLGDRKARRPGADDAERCVEHRLPCNLSRVDEHSAPACKAVPGGAEQVSYQPAR